MNFANYILYERSYDLKCLKKGKFSLHPKFKVPLNSKNLIDAKLNNGT